MGYRFNVTKKAQKDLQKLDEKQSKTIIKKLLWYAKQNNPLLYSIKMQDSKTGDIRFRVGDHRAIAVIDEDKSIILIVKIDHRKQVYR